MGRSEFVDLSPFDEPLVSVICLSGLYLQLLAVILAYSQACPPALSSNLKPWEDEERNCQGGERTGE